MREFGKWAAIAGIGIAAITCIIVMGSVVKSIVPAILSEWQAGDCMINYCPDMRTISGLISNS